MRVRTNDADKLRVDENVLIDRDSTGRDFSVRKFNKLGHKSSCFPLGISQEPGRRDRLVKSQEIATETPPASVSLSFGMQFYSDPLSRGIGVQNWALTQLR